MVETTIRRSKLTKAEERADNESKIGFNPNTSSQIIERHYLHPKLLIPDMIRLSIEILFLIFAIQCRLLLLFII